MVFLSRFFLSSICFLLGCWIEGASSVAVIGDSHSWAFQNIPDCRICHIGPVTMYRVGRDGLNGLNIRRFDVREGDVVVYVFGEIDVRCHICKQEELYNRDKKEIVESLAKNYIKTVMDNKSQYNNLVSVVYNVIPPLDLDLSEEFPVWGTIEERVEAARMLNSALEDFCVQSGVKFLNVYDHYANPDGSLCVELSDMNVHINKNKIAPIQEKLFEILSSG